MSDGKSRTTLETAIADAFIARTRSSGIGGPALTIAYAFGAMRDRPRWPRMGQD